jgi:hypothetical protein
MTSLDPRIKERLDLVVETTKDVYFMKQLLKKPKLLKEFHKIYAGCCSKCQEYINNAVYSGVKVQFELFCNDCTEFSLPILEKIVYKINK